MERDLLDEALMVWDIGVAKALKCELMEFCRVLALVVIGEE